MNSKLLIAMFTCAMIASSSVFAMESDDVIPSSISVKKSEVVSAWNGDKKINVNGRTYTLEGYIGGTFGNMFLSESDDSLITFSSMSYPPVKGVGVAPV